MTAQKREKVQWFGYPMAEHQGDLMAECRGYRIDIDRSSVYIGLGHWGYRYEVFVDYECVGSGFVDLVTAKQAAIDHVRELESKRTDP